MKRFDFEAEQYKNRVSYPIHLPHFAKNSIKYKQYDYYIKDIDLDDISYLLSELYTVESRYSESTFENPYADEVFSVLKYKFISGL